MYEKNEVIDNLIGEREYLKCELLYKRSIKGVKEILEMPELNDERYSYLLQPSIFNISKKI